MLAYASVIPLPLEATAVAQIRSAINQHNVRAGISGRLLFAGGMFFQVLEGPGDAVRRLFNVIRQDERHVRVVELFCIPVAERRYDDFGMRLETRRDSRVFDRFVRYMLHRLPAPQVPKDSRRVVEHLRAVLLARTSALPEARRKLVSMLPSVRFASADRDQAGASAQPKQAHAELEVMMRQRPRFRSVANPAYVRSKPMPFLSTLPLSLKGTDSSV